MNIFIDESIAETRMSICKKCEHFMKITSQCKVCWCPMIVKVKLAEVECPIGKWRKESNV